MVSQDLRCPQRLGSLVSDSKHSAQVVSTGPSERLFELNLSALAVWQLADGYRTVAEIISCLEQELDQSAGALMSDVRRCLENLAREKLLCFSSDAALRFSRENPSPRYQLLIENYQKMHLEHGEQSLNIPAERVFSGFGLLAHVSSIKRLIDTYEARSLLDYGSGKGRQYSRMEQELRTANAKLEDLPAEIGVDFDSVASYWGVDRPTCYDPTYPPFSALPRDRFDGVICTEVLEHCPEEDLTWILDELFAFAERFLFASIAGYRAASHLPNGENAHCTVRSAGWWRDRVIKAAAVFPKVHYEIHIDSKVITR